MAEQKRWFVEDCWYAAAWIHEVARAENRLSRMICEVPLVFYKTEDGRYVALDDRCCHRAAKLSMGRVEGNCIRCMYHGILYDPEGKGVEIPGQDSVPPSIAVRSYPVCEKGGMIWIWMGDPERANEDDIYDFEPLHDKETWQGYEEPCYMHYAANWLLIIDNLSDFSHIAFVHTNTLGGSEAYAYSTVAENLNKMEDGFSMVRWHDDSGAPPFHKKVIPAEEQGQPLDRCNLISIRVPGVFHMETFFAPNGWDKESGDRSECREYRNCQFITPETRNTTHFLWNYMRNFRKDEPEVTESLRASLLEGFIEDKDFIEEQQIMLEKSPDFSPRFIKADECFQYFRIIWAKRLKQEDAERPIVIKENLKRIL